MESSQIGQIYLKTKKEKTCILIYVADTSGQKSHTKGNRKETKIQEFLF
jgi:hypothetical protein